MGYLVCSCIVAFLVGFMTAKHKLEKCVICNEKHAKYCSACYQILKAKYIALDIEQRNTLRSIEYNLYQKVV